MCPRWIWHCVCRRTRHWSQLCPLTSRLQKHCPVSESQVFAPGMVPSRLQVQAATTSWNSSSAHLLYLFERTVLVYNSCDLRRQPSGLCPSPWYPCLQWSQRSPSTLALHRHWPEISPAATSVCESHSPPCRDPAGSQLQAVGIWNVILERSSCESNWVLCSHGYRGLVDVCSKFKKHCIKLDFSTHRQDNDHGNLCKCQWW